MHPTTFWPPALLALTVLAPAHAEIYRCPSKAGMPVYQNFPCDVDRPAFGPAPTTRASPTDAKSSPTRAIALRSKSTTPGAPRVGMTTAEIRAIWGEPLDVTTEEFARKDVELWTYSDSRSIEFDHKGRVTNIRW